MFFELLESRRLLTNTTFAAPGHWLEYLSSGQEGPTVPAWAFVSRKVEEGPSPPSGLNSPTTCDPENIQFVGDYSDSVDVSYTIGGNSIPGVDYIGLQSGTVTIPSGEWCAYIPFSIIPDTIPEWTFEYDEGLGEYLPFWETTITMTMTGYASHGDWSKVYELDNRWFKGGIQDDDELPVPPERPDCDCNPASPVQSSDGTALISSTELTSDAGGTSWGVNRDWSSNEGFSRGNAFGLGTTISQQPYLTWREEPQPAPTLQALDQQLEQKLAVVLDGNTAYYFDDLDHDGVYQTRAFLKDSLVKVGNNFVFTRADGAKYTFHGVNTTVSNRERGQLISYTDAGGNPIALTYANGKLASAQRVIGSGGTAVTESMSYSYYSSSDSIGQVQAITLERKVGTGAWQTARKAEYEYYPALGLLGNQHDLRTVTIKDASGAVIDKKYYRYYTQDDIDNGQNGYVHGLKYVFGSEAYARLVAALGSNVDALTDNQVKAYADHYFEYNSNRQVTKNVVAGAGGAATGGQQTYLYSTTISGNADGYNSWRTKLVETLPDGNQNITYTNFLGQVMLKVFRHPDMDGAGPDVEQNWSTLKRYNSEGRVILEANPSAVTGYDDAYADLVNFVSGDAQYLSDSAGMFTEYAYYPSTNIPSGWAKGYLEQVAIHQGSQGPGSCSPATLTPSARQAVPPFICRLRPRRMPMRTRPAT